MTKPVADGLPLVSRMMMMMMIMIMMRMMKIKMLVGMVMNLLRFAVRGSTRSALSVLQRAVVQSSAVCLL